MVAESVAATGLVSVELNDDGTTALHLELSADRDGDAQVQPHQERKLTTSLTLGTGQVAFVAGTVKREGEQTQVEPILIPGQPDRAIVWFVQLARLEARSEDQ